MKKLLKILRIISTVIGGLFLSLFTLGIIYWGIDMDSFRYDRNSIVTSNNLENEGPFILKKDSLYQINYIQGRSETGYFLKQQTKGLDTNFNIKCYFYLDSTYFSFKLKQDLKNENFQYETPEKIIAISDIESNYKIFRDFLIVNKVIDENLNWIFGKGHLVLNGDFIDRSHFTTQVLWFIYRLEQEAKKNGGKVHYILGNHEIMNIQGDHRYAKRKYRNIAAVLGLKQYQLYDTTTYLGKWLQTKNVVEKIGSYVFVHAGIAPELSSNQIKLSEMNQIARENYQIAYSPKQNESKKNQYILDSKTSPYWYRGYFQDDLQQDEIDKILTFYNCSQIIVGHTIRKEINRTYNNTLKEHAASRTTRLLTRRWFIKYTTNAMKR